MAFFRSANTSGVSYKRKSNGRLQPARLQSYKCATVDDDKSPSSHGERDMRHCDMLQACAAQFRDIAATDTVQYRANSITPIIAETSRCAQQSCEFPDVRQPIQPSSMSRIRPVRAASIAGAVVPVNLSSIASAGAGSSGRICSRFCSFRPFFILTITSPVRNFGKPNSRRSRNRLCARAPPMKDP